MNVLRLCGPHVNTSKCLNVIWKRQIFINHNVQGSIHRLLTRTPGFKISCAPCRDILEKPLHRRWKTCISCYHLPIASYSSKCDAPGSSSKRFLSSKEPTGKDAGKDACKDEDEVKLSIFKRFKKMYRDYWYVLVPVHLITSLGWFGGFYYLVKSGVDVVAALEYIGVSPSILEPLRDSKAGYVAVTYALYKIATPLRYMVTVGGTTISINHLKGHGYIKPIPPKEKLKEMYQEKKDTLIEKRQNIAEGIKQKKEQLKERTENIMRERRGRRKP